MSLLAVPLQPSLATADGPNHSRYKQALWHGGVFAATFLVFLSRRPDAILHAQFFAEDGKFWYADAYHLGWRCLLMPESGYLHSLSRSIALLSLLVPLALAPLVMNLGALCVQILPVNFFLSNRFAAIPLKLRLLGAFLYVALPNTFEIDANITTIQWHLALVAILFLLSPLEFSVMLRFLGRAALLFVSVDGPLGILLVPMAAVLHWKRRTERSLSVLLLLLPGALLQLIVILLSHSRRGAENGANTYVLLSILARQVFLAALIGSRIVNALINPEGPHLFVIESISALLGLAVIFYALWNSPIELKAFLCFAIAVMAICLVHPIATTLGRRPQWEMLQLPGIGVRYYFFPMLAFLASLLWTAKYSKPIPIRLVAFALLLFAPIGIYWDWAYPPFVDLKFSAFAAEFERAAPGTTVHIPVNPDWQMSLTKH